jgi:pseudouridine synthase
MSERLHKVLARAGVASRRKAEDLILEGRVAVNGEVVTELGIKVTDDDEVTFDGERIRIAKLFYVLLNKPQGVITTLSDPQRRPTILRYLPELGAILKPVGRLDMDSEGALLCTNDGDLAARLTHPRYGIEKEYHVVVAGQMSEEAAERLRRGVFIEGGRTAPCKVNVRSAKPESSSVWFTLHEGRNRQIRRMCEAVGHPVTSLKRTRIGSLRVKGMRAGEARMLSVVEVRELRRQAGLEA